MGRFQELGAGDPAIVQTHTCATEGYISEGEGGNVEEAHIGEKAVAKSLCSQVSTANFISKKAYSAAKNEIPAAFADLGEQNYRSDIDHVVIKSLFGGPGIMVKAKVEVPISLQGHSWVLECLLVDELFGGSVDLVLGAPFFERCVEKVRLGEDGSKVLTLIE